jgi:hypothetical protein
MDRVCHAAVRRSSTRIGSKKNGLVQGKMPAIRSEPCAGRTSTKTPRRKLRPPNPSLLVAAISVDRGSCPRRNEHHRLTMLEHTHMSVQMRCQAAYANGTNLIRTVATPACAARLWRNEYDRSADNGYEGACRQGAMRNLTSLKIAFVGSAFNDIAAIFSAGFVSPSAS